MLSAVVDHGLIVASPLAEGTAGLGLWLRRSLALIGWLPHQQYKPPQNPKQLVLSGRQRRPDYPIFAFNSFNSRMPRPISSFCRAGSWGISRSMVKGPV